MNKVKVLGILTILLLLVNLSFLAFFFLKTPMHKHGGGPRNLILEKLHFDAIQTTAYDTLIAAHRKVIQSTESKIRKLKNELYTCLTKDSSEAIRDSIIQELGELQIRIETIHYDHFERIKRLCKPEQQKEFEALTAELSSMFSPPRPQKK